MRSYSFIKEPWSRGKLWHHTYFYTNIPQKKLSYCMYGTPRSSFKKSYWINTNTYPCVTPEYVSVWSMYMFHVYVFHMYDPYKYVFVWIQTRVFVGIQFNKSFDTILITSLNRSVMALATLLMMSCQFVLEVDRLINSRDSLCNKHKPKQAMSYIAV